MSATSSSAASSNPSFTVKEFISGLAFGVLFAFIGLVSFTSLFPPPAGSPSQLTSSHLLSILFSSSFLLYFLLPIALFLFLLFTLIPLFFFPAFSTSSLTIDQRSHAQRRNLSALPSPYPNSWFRLCDSYELKISDVKYYHSIGQDFAIYRTAGQEEKDAEGNVIKGGNSKSGAGKAVILDAYCPHLGANLAVGGKVVGNCIECPFHGWTFNSAGKCTAIPYAKKIPDVAKTVSWKVMEKNGGVYVWHDIDRKDPEWEVNEVKEGEGALKLHGKASMEVSTHIQDLVTLHANHLELDYTNPSNLYRVQLKIKSNWTFPSSSSASGSNFTATRTGELSVSLFGFSLLSSVPVHITQLGISSLIYTIPSSSPLFGSFLISQSFIPSNTNIQGFATTVFGSQSGMGRVIGKIILEAMKQEMEREEKIWRERKWGSSGTGGGVTEEKEPKTEIENETGDGLRNRKEKGKAGGSLADLASAPVDTQYLEFLKRFYSATGTKFRDGNEW